MGSSDDVGDILHSHAVEDRGELVDDRKTGAGIDQIGGADLYGRRAREHHFDRVLCALHAADADHGDFHRLRDLPHHAQGEGEDRGAGQAAGDVGEDGTPGFEVDTHGEHRVDEAQCVGTGVLAGAGDRNDIGHVGRELHDDGLGRDCLHGPCHLRRRGGIGAEAHAAAVDVRAAHVDLEPPDLGARVELSTDGGVFLRGKAADIGDHFFMEISLQRRKLHGQDFVHAGILKAYGIDHAGGAFRDPRRRIAEPGMQGGPFEGKGSQAVDIIKLRKFLSKAEGAAGGDHGIVQFPSGKRDFCVSFRRSVFLAHHKISSLSSTGPSLQIRLYPLIVLQLQPMQAPKPQPIRSSKLNWPLVFATRLIARNIGMGPQV